MWSQRQVMEYALQRRRVLQTLGQPGTARRDVCDADPLLVRSALHHGEPSDTPCPVCSHTPLLILRYVFGAQLGQYSGRIRSSAELEEMENEVGEFKVCVVEVCSDCGWNFMIRTFVLGDGITRRPPRRQRTVEDIYG